MKNTEWGYHCAALSGQELASEADLDLDLASGLP